MEECTRVKNEKLDSFFFFFNDSFSRNLLFDAPCRSISESLPLGVENFARRHPSSFPAPILNFQNLSGRPVAAKLSKRSILR